MKKSLLAIVLALALPALAEAPKKTAATLADVTKASTAEDWRALDPENTLYLDLPAGRVVIELAPAFAPKSIANIKTLVRERYFDGLKVLRSQDNYVVQWGDPDDEKPKSLGSAAKTVPAELSVPIPAGQQFTPLADGDIYAAQVGHVASLPAGRDPASGQTWLAHCYAMVGVARGSDADSGNGSSLYVVNGHAPRALDRNVTVVGRVMEGMALLSTLPRGSGPLGFYTKTETQLPIKAIRLASELPVAERLPIEVLRSDRPIFADAVNAVRHRGGEWFKYSPARVELCNVPVVVRRHP